VLFTMRPKTDWEGVDAKLPTLRKPVAEPRKIEHREIRTLAKRLSARSLRRFAEQFPGVNLRTASLIWAEDTLSRGRDVKRPSVVFETWMRAAYPFLKQGRTE